LYKEEAFVFNRSFDPNHFLAWLSVGLVIYLWISIQPEHHRKTHYVAPIFGASLALAQVVGFSWGAVGVGFAFCVSMLVFVSIEKPAHAVSLMLILYVCRPWEVMPSNDAWLQVPRWCIWFWLLVWLASSLREAKFEYLRPIRSRGFIKFFVMGLWALASVSVSSNVEGSLRYYADTLFRAQFLVVVIALTVRSRSDVRLVSFAFALGIATLCLSSLWRFEGYDATIDVPKLLEGESVSVKRLEAFGSLGNSNDIAAVATIPLGFSLPLIFCRNASVVQRVFALLVVALIGRVVVASQSRGALLALLVQAGLYAISRSKKPTRLAALLVLAVSISLPVLSHLIGRNADDLDASTESRMNYYVTGMRMAIYSPIFGQGFGRYPYEFERFSTETLHEWGLRTAHSSWILVLSETGFVGLFIFLLINIRMFNACWKMRDAHPALLLALAGYSFSILFLSHTWLMFPWILFSIIEVAFYFHTKGEAVNGRA
jgi:O-antigen ligase